MKKVLQDSEESYTLIKHDTLLELQRLTTGTPHNAQTLQLTRFVHRIKEKKR